MLRRYEWNNWQKAAFVFWFLGGVLGVVGIFISWRLLETGQYLISRGALQGLLLASLVVLATGGTLHKVGTGKYAPPDE